MARDFMAQDRGKDVVTADGETVGTVEDIDENTAHVKPDQSLDDSIRSTLGWTSEGADAYELDHSMVSEISDTKVTLTQAP
jgi:sporulation protein YlmC with PRC-barrel domain